ncbi:hypothetical protein DLAC_06306 [Tieghemostelium lacteum]|uniref:DUF1206 domain-containing protein n=1 Tax=Tieghemostelium lacteum TaxID=361077 RepID=A0A151ZEG1_TIELA|nr:hypothetical protein DLAC_06306 [Tieghemostelium lacteum]|eukprot:KYQ92343.1 hypothetical protein DLAC_06306 [Tieghemostelium lacteum]
MEENNGLHTDLNSEPIIEGVIDISTSTNTKQHRNNSKDKIDKELLLQKQPSNNNISGSEGDSLSDEIETPPSNPLNLKKSITKILQNIDTDPLSSSSISTSHNNNNNKSDKLSNTSTPKQMDSSLKSNISSSSTSNSIPNSPFPNDDPKDSTNTNNPIVNLNKSTIDSDKIIVNNQQYEEIIKNSPLVSSTQNKSNSVGIDRSTDDLEKSQIALNESNPYYDRNLYFEYRDSHRDQNDNHKIPHPTIEIDVEDQHKAHDINEVYDEIKERKQLKDTSKFRYFKYLFDKNKYRWDPIQNRRFYLAAQIITRFGFLAKTILYGCLGIMSIAAAVDKKRAVKGPDGVFEELEEIFSSGIIIVFVLGLWCYGSWGLFYTIFDIDQLGHGSAGAILKRFGRVFSAGFYFVLGVDATRVLVHQKKQQSGTSQILGILYSHILGKIVVCILGVTFFVVCIVYLLYAIKPGKFKRELSTERMTKPFYWTALGFARLGALGRSMFFGAFGSVLIKAIADISKGKEPDTSLLGFQGVFQQIALYSATLLFIIAILVVFYALWCCWLMFFRRLPAHSDEVYAKRVLGTMVDPNYRFNGMIFRIPRRNRNIPNEL